jgi:spermidine synthase
MIPWEQLDAAPAPGGKHDLRLFRRGQEFSIRLGHNELMNSRLSGSEKALATLSCERIAARKKPKVLIGGLGMGFTLGAALKSLPADATLVVAELVPSVVAWARGPMAEIFGGGLEDPRVEIVVEDVARVIEAGGWDAIMLDVDNGPEAMTSTGNDDLYGEYGLGVARAALKGGGVLAVWSQGPDKAFAKRLHFAGFKVEDHRVYASDSGKGARHVIWLATKTDVPERGVSRKRR